MHRRRGFTLIEVLVALGLLVVITSLVLPVALTSTEAARARTAERILALAPGVARGQAQRSGGPVALVLAPGAGEGDPLRLLIVREPDPSGGGAADLSADPRDVSTWPPVAEPRELPEGTRLWEGRVDELEAFEAQAEARAMGASAEDPMVPRAFTEGDAEASPVGMGEPVEAVVLAWYLSDGSAMAGRATVVRLADGRVVRARVEPLVGRLVFTPAPELEEGAAPRVDEDGVPLEGDALDDPAEALAEPVTAGEPGEMESDALAFDRPEFERPEFNRPEFASPKFDTMEFESREFDALEFDALEFDRLEFDDLGEPASDGDRQDESQEQDEGDRANPEPPQPR
ncbi:MAG: prepilin-type N-terminal cleavage/methylation domain-containing protein [Phycisphaerales bacterium JB060]